MNQKTRSLRLSVQRGTNSMGTTPTKKRKQKHDALTYNLTRNG